MPASDNDPCLYSSVDLRSSWYGRFTQLYTSRAKPTGIADAELLLPLYARQVTMEMKGGQS